MTNAEIDSFFREQLSRALRGIYEAEVQRLREEGADEQNIPQEEQESQIVAG